MVRVVAKAVYMEDKLEEAIEMFAELIKETKKEKGCLAYDLYQDINEKTVLTMIEEWESLECLKNHSNAEPYTRIIPKLRSYRVSTEVNIYKKVF